MNARAAGMLVLVVGPSGVGKDTIINHARERLAGLPEIVFARRCVTRPADAALEDHDTLSESDFHARAAAGGFALHWRAHGLHYGLPVEIHGVLAAGRSVVANVSRTVLDTARLRFPRVLIVNVTASPEVLAARLSQRGREPAEAVGRRLRRADAYPVTGSDVVTIDNSGPADRAVAVFVDRLRSIAIRGDRLRR